MNRKRMFLLLIGLALLALAACGGAAVAPPEPTLVEVTPLPAPTDAPPTEEPEPSLSPLATQLDDFISGYAEEDPLSGVVFVARGDELVLSKGYGLADRENSIPNTPQTRFLIGSLTKAFTAMAIMQLQEQGKLSVSDPICDYLAECPDTWQDITIHHLLTHSSGIYNFTDSPEVDQMALTPTPPETIIQSLIDRPLDFVPGSAWSYSNSGYLLLGLIIEQVSGQSYEEFLQQNIFEPLGMVNTGYGRRPNDLAVGYQGSAVTEYIDPTWAFSAGALYSTVEDLHRWAQALKTEALVSSETLDEIFTPHVRLSPVSEDYYGYGWFIGITRRLPAAWHPGDIAGYSAAMLTVPEEDVVSIFLSNQEGYAVSQLNSILATMVLDAK